MAESHELEFDEAGLVRMDDLPDVDPDVALSPAEQERVHRAVVDSAPAGEPAPLSELLDAVFTSEVVDVDPSWVADESPNGSAATVDGPIRLLDDDPASEPDPTVRAAGESMNEVTTPDTEPLVDDPAIWDTEPDHNEALPREDVPDPLEDDVLNPPGDDLPFVDPDPTGDLDL